MRKIVEPTITNREYASTEREVLHHPAYAQVAIHHVSGNIDLYGSDFTHKNFVTLSIKRSELHRDLARDWHFEKDELIEIALSEAQYATMISSPNRSGVTCTLQHFNGEPVPGLPRRNSTHIHNEEFREKLAKTIKVLKNQKQEMELATSKLPKKVQSELLSSITTAIREIESSIPFLVKSFDEHMETNIEKAKVEVNAYVTNTIHRAGLTALQEPGKQMLEFNPRTEGK